jgi:hypothetical protein
MTASPAHSTGERNRSSLRDSAVLAASPYDTQGESIYPFRVRPIVSKNPEYRRVLGVEPVAGGAFGLLTESPLGITSESQASRK